MNEQHTFRRPSPGPSADRPTYQLDSLQLSANFRHPERMHLLRSRSYVTIGIAATAHLVGACSSKDSERRRESPPLQSPSAADLGALSIEELYEHGVEQERASDFKLAVVTYTRACSGGHERACVRAAAFPMMGLDQPVDRTRAVALLRASCARDSWIACVYEVVACGRGDGLCEAQAALKSLDEKRSKVKRACDDERNGDACLLLVLDGLRRSPADPTDELLALLDRSCKGGTLDGCTFNGLTGFFEASADHKLELAASAYACERGNGEACGALAYSYGIAARDRNPQKELYLDKACHSEPSAYYLGGAMGGPPMLATTCALLFRALEHSDDPAEKARSEEAKRLSCKLGAGPVCALLED